MVLLETRATPSDLGSAFARPHTQADAGWRQSGHIRPASVE
ncbi:hypothetical protein [Polaromonas sp. CG9_12]|nr:hypothetical protein [Polaromonas sp. CG9_12]